MATLINNARIVEQVYEFGVDQGEGLVTPCGSYEAAKLWAEDTTHQIKMRVLYRTEWMDAT
jgi:hypothetical protein